MKKQKRNNKKSSGKSKIAKIIESKCDRSPFCPVKRVCPTGAVERAGFFMGKVVINDEKCIGCGKCIQICPHKAVSF
ncbi:4Fe-4S binding protein [Gudongella sp. DL1XJH-153]|uniref:4Fe-4S binding protein n=1 Tax=Gudongella sp. DL1XJH-153 TaxID=3409804 RepID=UPI003BB60C4C